MPLKTNNLYKILLDHFGKQNWWPIDKKYHQLNKTDPRFEIMVGAILTQNTAWINVEKALNNLKSDHALDASNIYEINENKLKKLIQPSGYYNQKTQRLKQLSFHLKNNYSYNLDEFFNRKTNRIRSELLSLNGIGPETADSILLYAGEHPIFVVDAYTKRISKRIPLQTSTKTYDDIQTFFQNSLTNHFKDKKLVETYKELHALIVELAKNFCKKNPNCNSCILKKNCSFKKINLSK